MSYGIDLIMAQIDIAFDGRTVVVKQGATSYTVSIAAGRYWGHRDSTLNGQGYTSLFLALESALNASAMSGTFTFSSDTPSESNAQTYGGLRLTNSTTDFELEFDHASWTLPVGLLGGLDNSVVAAATLGGSQVYISPYMRSSDWTLYNLYTIARGADDKRSDESFRSFASDSDSRFAYTYDWSHSADGDMFRPYHVSQIPAAHIRASRALESDYASTGELAWGDENNAFVELVWERARVIGSDSREGDIIIVHNSNTDLEVASHDYDIVRFDDAMQRASWLQSDLLTMIRKNGEYYNLAAKFRIKEKHYDH